MQATGDLDEGPETTISATCLTHRHLRRPEHGGGGDSSSDSVERRAPRRLILLLISGPLGASSVFTATISARQLEQTTTRCLYGTLLCWTSSNLTNDFTLVWGELHCSRVCLYVVVLDMQESLLLVLCCIGLELTAGACYLIQNSIMYVDDDALASYICIFWHSVVNIVYVEITGTLIHCILK